MKKQIMTLILLLGAFLSQAQKEARLCFQFDDKSQIEKVETRFSMPGQAIAHIFVPGEEIEKRKWMFTIPDTVNPFLSHRLPRLSRRKIRKNRCQEKTGQRKTLSAGKHLPAIKPQQTNRQPFTCKF